MENNSQNKFSRHSIISYNVKEEEELKTNLSQKRKQARDTEEAQNKPELGKKAGQGHASEVKKCENLTGNYKRQHKTLNLNYYNWQLSSFLFIQHNAQGEN